MRKIFMTMAAAMVLTLFAHAQTEKGDWLVGGNFQLNTASNNTTIGFTPMAGLFVVNNLAVGGNFSLVYSKSGNDKTTAFGIGPFARYYFNTSNNIRPLFHGSFNYVSSKLDIAGTSSTNNGTNYFLGAGVALFINDNVSIEGLAGYDHTKYSNFDGSGGFKLSIGFQVYLHKNQVAKITGR